MNKTNENSNYEEREEYDFFNGNGGIWSENSLTLKEKIEKAIEYADAMAQGVFPISGVIAELDSDMNELEIVRTMYFIRDVLKEAGERKPVQKKTPISQFPIECLENFVYTGDKTITALVEQLKALTGLEKIRGFSFKTISDWLKQQGCLTDDFDKTTGVKKTVATDLGKEKGIFMETRHNRFGVEYDVVIYTQIAQKFIVESMPEIVS